MPKFFLTTAIDYANGDPHLGHALEKIGADAIARYRRLRGDDVHFLIGMDEHGQKVAQTAAARGLEPQALVDQVAATFEATWRRLGVSFDQFIRTTSPGHKAGVTALVERMFQRSRDDFYEKRYEGWYCVGCELFKRDDEIVDGKCVLHPTRELQWAEETNWFFRLTRYQEFLKRLFAERPDFLEPATRRNEILSLLESGLEDISITRSRLAWAIPFPEPTSAGETQGTWVWFDALPNYLTATGYPDEVFTRLWPADLHVIGKDITRLHCVIWPAMLESAGLALPGRVWAHGFVQVSGERFSKSAGVKVELAEAVDRHGPDAFRYFLLREVGFESDGNFSWERFDERYTADLADGLGNLASRALQMLVKYREGRVPDTPADTSLDAAGQEATRAYAEAMDAFDLRRGAEAFGSLVTTANLFIQQTAPWALAKAGREAELDQALAALARCLWRLAVLVSPFLPGKAEELWAALGQAGSAARAPWDALAGPPVAGATVRKPENLFPKSLQSNT
ncbi:MAG TPA: methionine--tRNA ligase [Gemmatimonadales bacterium]|nr:methionine--tRNA ligase [Gemmatimonadales bacterium]